MIEGEERASQSPSWDWAGVSDTALRELQRQGEAYLSAQLTASIAADQRAMTTATIFAAISAGLAAAAATVGTIQNVGLPNTIAIVIIAAGMLIGSLVCAFAARPVGFYNPGYQPLIAFALAKNDAWLLQGLVEKLETRITVNARVQNQAAVYLKVGYCIGVGSIALAAGYWCGCRFC